MSFLNAHHLKSFRSIFHQQRFMRSRAPVTFIAIVSLLSMHAVGQDTVDSPETAVVSEAEPNETAAEGPAADSTKGTPQAKSPSPTFEELQKDPEYQAEVKRATEAFNQTKFELKAAVANQFEIMVRYRNEEESTPEDFKRYNIARDEVRQLMRDMYEKSLDLCRVAPDPEAVQYVLTMAKHRFDHGIYDYLTAEGSARMIDGGLDQLFLYLVAARASIVSGQFETSRNIYKALKEETLEDIDRRLFYTIDQLEEEYLKEMEIREKEKEADDLPRVKLSTTEGEIVVELYLNEAPSTVSHFIKLVESGFYDGLDFHQVVRDIVALTGDPTGLGDGHSGQFLIDENDRPDARSGLRGSLVMAKLPDNRNPGSYIQNSSSSQFAIMFTPVTNIQAHQTVFGRVIEGMEVLSRLRLVDPSKEKKKNEIVLPSDRILEATVIRRPEELPEPEYFDPRASRE